MAHRSYPRTGQRFVRAVAGGVPEGGAVVAARRADEHLQRGGGGEHILPHSHRVTPVRDALAELAREPRERRAVRRVRRAGAELGARVVAVVTGRSKGGVQVPYASQKFLAGQIRRPGELLAGVPHRLDDGGEGGHVALLAVARARREGPRREGSIANGTDGAREV